MILEEIPSYPVAFCNLFICLVTKSSFISLKNNLCLGCQTALLRIIKDWKKALDDNKFIAAILMDLSKAFDCLPHNLLMLKLEAYGLSENSLKLYLY
jgi:hypothetical protein